MALTLLTGALRRSSAGDRRDALATVDSPCTRRRVQLGAATGGGGDGAARAEAPKQSRSRHGKHAAIAVSQALFASRRGVGCSPFPAFGLEG